MQRTIKNKQVSLAIIPESNNSNQKLQVRKTANLYKKQINQIRVGEAVVIVTTPGTSGAYEGARRLQTNQNRQNAASSLDALCCYLFSSILPLDGLNNRKLRRTPTF